MLESYHDSIRNVCMTNIFHTRKSCCCWTNSLKRAHHQFWLAIPIFVQSNVWAICSMRMHFWCSFYMSSQFTLDLICILLKAVSSSAPTTTTTCLSGIILHRQSHDWYNNWYKQLRLAHMTIYLSNFHPHVSHDDIPCICHVIIVIPHTIVEDIHVVYAPVVYTRLLCWRTSAFSPKTHISPVFTQITVMHIGTKFPCVFLLSRWELGNGISSPHPMCVFE